MYIDYLCNCPEYVNTVSNWIYSEFVVKAKSNVNLDEIVEYFNNTNEKSFPITLVAILNDECVGTISIFDNDLKTQNELTPWLASLYVNPDYRNQGIAKKLIDKVKSIVKDLGFDSLYLRTEHTSEYYIRLGWKFEYKTKDEKGQDTEVFRVDLE